MQLDTRAAVTAWPCPSGRADAVPTRLASVRAERRARQHARHVVRAVLVRGGLTVALQPIVAIASMEVTGYEALARFPGARGWPPDHWFQQAEQVGLGTALEEAAVRAALQQLSRLPAATSLALNVSGNALLASSAIRTMLGNGAAGARLVLELTEHQSIAQPDELCAVLADLRAAGVRIAIDDAGAGYAGLERIILIAPEIIKLDRGLVRGVASHPRRQAMCEAMVGFARRTDTVVIAEGVETEADLRSLQELGVTHAQGFLLGRPAETAAPAAVARRGSVGRQRASGQSC